MYEARKDEMNKFRREWIDFRQNTEPRCICPSVAKQSNFGIESKSGKYHIIICESFLLADQRERQQPNRLIWRQQRVYPRHVFLLINIWLGVDSIRVWHVIYLPIHCRLPQEVEAPQQLEQYHMRCRRSEVCDVARNEVPFNPIVKLRHVKIFGLFTHHEYYQQFFHVRAKFKTIKFSINCDKNQIHDLLFSCLQPRNA